MLLEFITWDRLSDAVGNVGQSDPPDTWRVNRMLPDYL
jgi:hypothetical protein